MFDNDEYTQPTDKIIEASKKFLQIVKSIITFTYKNEKRRAKNEEQKKIEKRNNNNLSHKARDFSARSNKNRSLEMAIHRAKTQAALLKSQHKEVLALSGVKRER